MVFGKSIAMSFVWRVAAGLVGYNERSGGQKVRSQARLRLQYSAGLLHCCFIRYYSGAGSR